MIYELGIILGSLLAFIGSFVLFSYLDFRRDMALLRGSKSETNRKDTDRCVRTTDPSSDSNRIDGQ
jgi:hypothetical protein